MRFMQAFDFLIAIAREPDLNFVIAVTREIVRYESTTAGSQRKSFNMFFLRNISADAKSITFGRTAWQAQGETTNFLRGRNVTIQQSRGKNADRSVVKAMTVVVLWQ